MQRAGGGDGSRGRSWGHKDKGSKDKGLWFLFCRVLGTEMTLSDYVLKGGLDCKKTRKKQRDWMH